MYDTIDWKFIVQANALTSKSYRKEIEVFYDISSIMDRKTYNIISMDE